jgi:hypothetical protein
VDVDELNLALQFVPAQGGCCRPAVRADFHGGVSGRRTGEERERGGDRGGSRASSTLGAAGRAFGFDHDPDDGYFDPQTCTGSARRWAASPRMAAVGDSAP